jgi:hypothetical protein
MQLSVNPAPQRKAIGFVSVEQEDHSRKAHSPSRGASDGAYLRGVSSRNTEEFQDSPCVLGQTPIISERVSTLLEKFRSLVWGPITCLSSVYYYSMNLDWSH